MRKTGWRRDALVWAIVFAGAVIVLSPVLFTGAWGTTHDGFRYVVIVARFRDAIEHGEFYPRWMPDAFGRYGEPVFVYYQPAFFYLGALLSYLTREPAYTIYLPITVLFTLGSMGVYYAVKPISGWPGALAAAFFFLLTPYLMCDLHVRGDYGEITAVCCVPWTLVFLSGLHRSVHASEPGTGAMLGLALSLAAVIYSHPAIALITFASSLVAAAWFVAASEAPKRRQMFFRAALGLGMALVFSAPYWSGFFVMRPYVGTESVMTGYYGAQKHTVYLDQFFFGSWGFGKSVEGRGDGMPFLLGLPHFLACSMGAYFGRKHTLIRIAYAGLIVSIIFMTPLTGWLWEHVGLFHDIQWPWRLLGMTAVFQAVCCGGLALMPASNAAVRGTVCVALLALAVAWPFERFWPNQPYDLTQTIREVEADMPREFVHFTADNPFLSRFSTVPLPKPSPEQPRINAEASGKSEELPESNKYHVAYRVTLEAPGAAIVNQLYLPGWQIWVNGNELTPEEIEKNMLPDGRMRVPLPAAGAYEIRAHYYGPKGCFTRAVVAALLSACFFAFLVWDRLRFRKAQPALAA